MRNRALFALAGACLFTACGDNAAAPQDQGTDDLAVSIDLGGQPDLSGTADGSGGADLRTAADLLPSADLLSAADGSAVDAFMCTPSAFLNCFNNFADYCNASGTGLVVFDCGAACNASTMGCGQCTGDTCTGGQLTPCDTVHQKTGTSTACVTLQAGGNVSMCASGGTTCQQCAGSFVCGDGTHYGSSINTQYACNGNGTLGTATACAFGCDPASGKCRDLVPANQAASHLDATGTPDTFTCLGTQDATLPAVAGVNGDTIAINTTNHTITNGATTYTARWGIAYAPKDGTGAFTGQSQVIVAHIKSLSVAAGATINVTGANGLIVLVDGDASILGAAGMVTKVNLAADKTTTAGPGASAVAQGGTATATTHAGGGGAGHGAQGGLGGNGPTNTGGGAQGASYGHPSLLEAGARGGGGDSATLGGHGGGALQVSACGNVRIGAFVVVNASGGGGGGGLGAPTTGAGGGGGGSGGTLLLEAATFNDGTSTNTISGTLASNGGGGGGGGGFGAPIAPVGNPGSNWDPTTTASTPAAAGAGATGGINDNGGAGGAGSAAPQAGDQPASGTGVPASGYGGGGAGGAVGRIYVNRSPAVSAATTLSSASPTVVTSTTCVTANGAAPAMCLYP